EVALEPRQSFHGIRPGIEAVPGAIEMSLLLLAQAGNAILHEKLVEDHAMEIVDARPRQRTAAHALHRRLVSAAPVVGKARPIGAEALLPPHRLELANDAAAPIDDGAEDIEDESLDGALSFLPHESDLAFSIFVVASNAQPSTEVDGGPELPHG